MPDCQCDMKLIQTDPGRPDGLSGKEKDGSAALKKPVHNGLSPVIAAFNLASVDPDIISLFFQILSNLCHKPLILIMCIAEKNLQRFFFLFQYKLVFTILADIQLFLFTEINIFRSASIWI